MNIPAMPASATNICFYAAFLARSLKYTSVKQYISTIGLLHKEFGLTNPLTDNYFLSSLLNGITRVKGDSVNQKLPITLDLLFRVFKLLNFRSSIHSSFWAICLTAFFGMFRNPIFFPQLKAHFHLANSSANLILLFLLEVSQCISNGVRLFSSEIASFRSPFPIFPIHHFAQLRPYRMLFLLISLAKGICKLFVTLTSCLVSQLFLPIPNFFPCCVPFFINWVSILLNMQVTLLGVEGPLLLIKLVYLWT